MKERKRLILKFMKFIPASLSYLKYATRTSEISSVFDDFRLNFEKFGPTDSACPVPRFSRVTCPIRRGGISLTKDQTSFAQGIAKDAEQPSRSSLNLLAISRRPFA